MIVQRRITIVPQGNCSGDVQLLVPATSNELLFYCFTVLLFYCEPKKVHEEQLTEIR